MTTEDLADPEKFMCQRENFPNKNGRRECGKVFVGSEVVIDLGGRKINMLTGETINVVEDRRSIDDVLRAAKHGKTVLWCPSCGLAHILKISGTEVLFEIAP